MARLAGIGSPSVRRQEEIIQGQSRQLGTCLVERFPRIADDAIRGAAVGWKDYQMKGMRRRRTRGA